MQQDSILSIIHELKAEPSKNAKVDILNKHRNNEVLRRVFKLAYEPSIVFWIKSIPQVTEHDSETDLNTAMNQLGMLRRRVYTGNDAIYFLELTLKLLSPDDAKVLSMIVEKDLDCGVQTKTINKVWKNLIPEYPVMLASSMNEKNMSRIRFPCYAQKKEDGMRINVHVDTVNGGVSYTTRKGKPVFCNEQSLDSQLLSVGSQVAAALEHKPSMIVLDGEMLALDKVNGGLLPRKTSNGICNKAIRDKISDEEREILCVHLWDYIPGPLFDAATIEPKYAKGDKGYAYRNLLLDAVSENHERVKVCDTYIIESIEQAYDLCDVMITKGFEGIILKNTDSIWEPKRSQHHVKMKAVLDADVTCVDVIPGTGKYEGMIGSLVCESGDGVRFNVGTGLSDEQRALDNSIYVGNIIEVKYNELIRNDAGDYSLFLPVFVEVRNDKDTPDNLLGG